jgi:hypothetical protein
MGRQEGDLGGGADVKPSLLVISQPSGGAAIFAGEAGMSRENRFSFVLGFTYHLKLTL